MMRDIYLILHIVPNECVGIKFDLSNIITFFSVAIPFNHSQEVINNYKKDIQARKVYERTDHISFYESDLLRRVQFFSVFFNNSPFLH